MHTGLPRKPEMTSKQWLHLGAYILFKEVTVSEWRSDKTKEKGVEGLPGEFLQEDTYLGAAKDGWGLFLSGLLGRPRLSLRLL